MEINYTKCTHFIVQFDKIWQRYTHLTTSLIKIENISITPKSFFSTFPEITVSPPKNPSIWFFVAVN